MRTATGTLASKFLNEVTSLCSLLKITRRDGTVIYLTDHDSDLVVGGHTYLHNPGYTLSSIESAVSSGVTGFDITLAKDDAELAFPDLYSGLFDKANVLVTCVDWSDPSNGVMNLFGGTVGPITWDAVTGLVTLESNGLLSRDRQIKVETYSPTCRADLGDARCKFDIEGASVTSAIDTVISQTKFTAAVVHNPDALPFGSNWALGTILFTSGENDGLSIQVAKTEELVADTSSTFFLTIPPPRTIAPGDTFKVYPGCQKFLTFCRDRFHNAINFQGEPFYPSGDTIKAE